MSAGWILVAVSLSMAGQVRDVEQMPALNAVIIAPEPAPPADPTPPTPPPVREAGPGGFGFGGGKNSPGYSATWYPSRPSTNGSNLALLRQSLNLGAPIWIDGDQKVIASASVRNNSYFTDAILPDSGGQPFPSELWNISLGLTYARTYENGWSGAASVNFGSASDKPFHSIEEITLGFLGYLRVPTRNDRDAWLFSLMYSPTGNFNFPIPGIAYAWNPNETFRASIGIPFSLQWTPTPDWTFQLSYFPVTNVNATASYRVCEGVMLRGGFEWLYEAYFLADRAVEADRFIGFEKRLFTGVRWDILPRASLDLNAGYAFDRYYGIGQNTLGDLQNEVNISPGAFVGASFLMRF